MPVLPEITKRIIARTLIILLVFILGINAFGLYSPKASADTGPDLIVKDITLSPNDPVIDDTVTITATIKNQGTILAGTNYVTCYVDSTILDTISVNALDAGVMATVSFTWKATQGSHTIKAIADSSGIVAESNENNNANTYALTTLAADLIIQSITWSPPNPSRGDNVIFSIFIKNQGNGKAHNTNVNFRIDGNTRGTQAVAALNPGESITKTYSWPSLTGQHILKAVVDETNTIKESDETNNELTVTFAAGAPDLIVQAVTWTPENPSRNDPVIFTAIIKNQGSGRADACALGYYVDDLFISVITVATLEAGASSNVTFTWTVSADVHHFKLVIDYYKNIAESDETNNENTVSLATLAPDLIVKDITWEPKDAGVGDVMTFTVIIKNQGGGKAQASQAAYYISGAYQGYLPIPQLDAGAEVTKTFTWTAESGSITVSVVVDYNDYLSESNEANNKVNKSIPILQPDLIIPSISWSPENPTIGETVTFTTNITNQGGGRAENFYVTYYMDNTLLTSEFIVKLDPGASVNRTCTWKVLNGRHIFKAIANYNNYILESDKNNNENSIVFVPELPDLAITSISWSPPDMPTGNDVTFDINIENQGPLSAGPSRIAYYVDDAVAGYTDIGQLEPGSSVTEHFTWGASGGHHTISITLDSNNQIVEIDETNNIKVLNLPLPDLVVQDITFSPSDAPIGDTVVITASIINQGASKTESSLVTLYIDGTKIASQDLPPIDAGESIIKSFNWVAEAGVHTFKITADIDNTVIEVNETNNEKEIKYATATPDLIIEGMSWTTNNQMNSNESTFTITIKNIGNGTAGESQVKYWFDSSPAETKNIASIPAGVTADFSFVAILSAGQHTASITADYNNDITELDENNNQKIVSFSTLAPDLVVRTITYSPLNAKIGDKITITAKVENRGNTKAAKSRVALSIDGSIVDYAEIPELDITALTTVELTWVSTEGQHEISIIADADQTIVESNELNNTKSRTISFEKAGAPVKTTVNTTTASATDGGFMASWWWLLLLFAALLGIGAFVSAFRALRKKS